jgi:hypothetical protein
MTKKILLAGILGGILMFLWEGFAHQVLPLGEAGISALDNEAAFVAVVKDTVKRPGFYIFPGGEMLQPGLTGAHKEEVMKKAMEQWQTGPSGIMIVHPEGTDAGSPMLFIRQCLFDIGVTLLAAFLLSMTSLSSFGARLLFVSLIGLVPTLNAELPYWNWYGFPPAYLFAQGFTHLMGFVLAGLVIARLVKTVPLLPAAAARIAA